LNKRDKRRLLPEVSAPPRGLVGKTAMQVGMTHQRFEVDASLAAAVEFIWFVQWNLKEPLEQKVVAHPTFHVVFESGRAQIYGPQTRLFRRSTQGLGEVIGVKMKPGLGARVVDVPTRWENRRGPMTGSSGARASDCARCIADDVPLEEKVEAVRLWARDAVAGPMTEKEALANRAASLAASTPGLTTVAGLAAACAVSVRGLQRVFRECVGCSPKWVLRCYRMHEALAWLERDPSLADLALALEYSDQAHFSRDFKRVVGQTPAAYRRAAAAGGER
jgi:AraC-like DNA-binding protein